MNPSLKNSCLCCLLFFFITTGYAQKAVTSVTLSGTYQNTALNDILEDLSAKYDVNFFYKKEWLKDLKANISFTGMPLPYLLDTLLKPAGLTGIIYNPSTVIIVRSSDMAIEFTQNYFIDRREQENFLKTNDITHGSEPVTLGDTTGKEHPKEALVKGRIIDGQNDQPLASVNINFETVNRIVTSGSDGSFSIRLPTGRHFVEVSIVGYDTRKFDLDVKSSAGWKIVMFPKPIQLEEVQISGTQETSVVHSTIAGITSLTSKEIKVLPVFMGEADVIKSILTMPGVSSTGEGTEGFHVRGGNVDQNLILQDEAIIFNSSHALGFFSVFNPDLVNNVTLYKGHIPAQYGGRISSVLDVKLKDFDNDGFTINGGLGMVTSRLAVNSPLFNNKTSVLAGGRFTYSDWILKNTHIPDIQNSAASFYDYNFKVDQKLPGGGMLTASVYRSYDHVQFSDQFGFKWKTGTYGLSWSQLIGRNTINDLHYIYGQLDNQYINPGSLNSYILSNGLSYHKMKDEITITSLSHHEITSGLEGILYLSSPDKMEPYADGSRIIPDSVTRENGLETALFINDEYTINHLFSLSAGLRFNYFESLGPSTVYQYTPGVPYNLSGVTDSTEYRSGQKTGSFSRLEPRLSLKYTINAISSFKASYDRLNQFIHLISNTVSPVPVDLWQVSNRYLQPESSDNYSVGYFRSLGGSRWESSLDVFYRSTANIPLYRNFADLRLNQHLETELIEAKGRSYGLEFYLRRLKGNPKGWISYTYSRAQVHTGNAFDETTVNNGDWFSTFYDKPHHLNIVFDLQVTRGSNLSLNYTYSSGRPVTAPVADYYNDHYYLPYYPVRNGYRIPYYSRLDASFTIHRNVVRNHRYTDSITLSVYNLFSRDNPFSVIFRRNTTDNAYAYKISILGNAFPSITYNFNY